MASDDMNACVDDLVAQRPKNILAALVSDDGPYEGGRDPVSKQERLQLRRAVIVEMLKEQGVVKVAGQGAGGASGCQAQQGLQDAVGLTADHEKARKIPGLHRRQKQAELQALHQHAA